MLNVEPTTFETAVLDADGRMPDALYDLGLMYATGDGAPQDLVSAHKWFNLAAIRGDIRAREERAALSEMMSADQISLAQRQAREWLQHH
jgi:TPR repeat protein